MNMWNPGCHLLLQIFPLLLELQLLPKSWVRTRGWRLLNKCMVHPKITIVIYMLFQTYLTFLCGTKKINCKEGFFWERTIHLRCLCLIAINIPLFIPSISNLFLAACIPSPLITGVAGGLTNLSKMPACNLMLLGAQRRTLSGFSSTSLLPHTGYIYHCDVVQSLPPVSINFFSFT